MPFLYEHNWYLKLFVLESVRCSAQLTNQFGRSVDIIFLDEAQASGRPVVVMLQEVLCLA